MDDWCWERIINPVKKCVFSLRWQTSAENNITAEDSEESLCGAAEPRGALPVHKGLGRVTQPVVLWMHYHQSTVNISFTGSLTLFKLKKKKKTLRREQKSSRSRLFSLETERVRVKPETCSGVCESVPASRADFCADVCQHTDTMSPCATERQRHIHPTDPGEDNKHRTSDESRRYH